MSTRGIVAVGTPAHWEGTYNHFDSYPESLGEEIKREAAKRGLEELARTVRDNPQGFSNFPSDPYDKSEPSMRVKSSDTTTDTDWLFWEYVYIINPKEGKVWWGKSTYKREGEGPHDFKAGPPKTWHLLVKPSARSIAKE